MTESDRNGSVTLRDYVRIEDIHPDYTHVECRCGRDKWIDEDDFYSIGRCPHDD